MCPEASVSTLNLPFLFGRESTGWLVIFSLSFSNALWCSSVQLHSFFSFNSLRDLAIWLKFLMNLLWKFVNPKKLSTSLILVGILYSLTALTLLFSIWIYPFPMTTPNIGISSILKLYFDLLKYKLHFSVIFKNHIILSSSSFIVFTSITKSSI